MSKHAISRKKALLFSTASSVMMVSAALNPSSAQDDGAQGGLDTIVVTAQKREQSIQEVGISAQAFSGEGLRERGVTRTNDLAALTPGLSFSNPGGEGQISAIVLRGVGLTDFNDHQESPVALYSDEAYVAYTGATTTQMFDLERVEVLKGPQGTLFGRNATGGLIHLISRRPTQELSGYAEIETGSYGTVRTEAALGGPLGDAISVRASGYFNRHGAYVENIGGADLNGTKVYAGRFQALIEPTENFEALLSARYSKVDQTAFVFEAAPAFIDANGAAQIVPSDVDQFGTCAGCDPLGFNDLADGDPFTVNSDMEEQGGFLDREDFRATARLELDLGAVTVTSITDYADYEKGFLQESDGTPISSVTFGTDTTGDQFSQEIRFSGASDRFDWVLGGYYLDYDLDVVLDITSGFPPLTSTPMPTLAGGAPLQIALDYAVDTTSWSLFGQGEYQLTPQWSIIGGVRYLDESKDYDYSSVVNLFIPLPPPAGDGMTPMVVPIGGLDFDAASVGDLAGLDETAVAAKAQLNFKPTDDVLFYAGATRGVKAGGFNAPAFPPASLSSVPFSKEILWAYEGGMKATFADGRARLNTSVYYYDYTDYQAFAFLALEQRVFNADAKVVGADAELSVAPGNGLEMTLAANYMDTEVKDVENGAGLIRDRELPNAPKLQLSFIGAYEREAFDGMVRLQGDVSYRSETHFEIQNDPATTIDGYAVGNIRLSYAPDNGRWSIAGFVRNVTNNEYITHISNNASFGHVQRFYARPRWFGVQLQANLN